MTKKIKEIPFGFCPRFKNLRLKFLHLNEEDGKPVYEILFTEDSEIVGVELVSEPANKSNAVVVTTIDDGKDETIFESLPITSTEVIFYQPPSKLKLLWLKLVRSHCYRKLINLSYLELDEVKMFRDNGFTLHVYGKEGNHDPHAHLIHDGDRINIRIDYEGNYMSTVKGYNGENEKSRKFLKKNVIPKLKKRHKYVYLNGKKKTLKNITGSNVLKFLWNENNSDIIN